MYLMYVDESGDTGIVNSPTRYFVLSGIVVHELRWRVYLDQMVDFRKRMLRSFGLHLREEIHASNFINNPGNLARIKRYDRLAILRLFADELATMTDLNIINVVVDKVGKQVDYDVFTWAWKTLIQRFENTISYHNFPGPKNADERGTIFPDNTDVKKLTLLLRKMRRFNPVPNQPIYGPGYRNQMLSYTIEDPNFRSSADSFFIQAADLTAYLLYQNICPNSYMKKKQGNNYFLKLNSILCKVATRANQYGIVNL